MDTLKQIIKAFFIAAILFAIGMGILFIFIDDDPLRGIVHGAISGACFGLLMAIFVGIQSARMRSSDENFEGAKIIHQGGANHFMEAEARGGWLTLTTDSLHFRSHKLNIQNQPVDIPLNDISDASSSLTIGIIPNGLTTTLKNGDLEKFVVSNRTHWVNTILDACGGN